MDRGIYTYFCHFLGWPALGWRGRSALSCCPALGCFAWGRRRRPALGGRAVGCWPALGLLGKGVESLPNGLAARRCFCLNETINLREHLSDAY